MNKWIKINEKILVDGTNISTIEKEGLNVTLRLKGDHNSVVIGENNDIKAKETFDSVVNIVDKMEEKEERRKLLMSTLNWLSNTPYSQLNDKEFVNKAFEFVDIIQNKLNGTDTIKQKEENKEMLMYGGIYKQGNLFFRFRKKVDHYLKTFSSFFIKDGKVYSYSFKLDDRFVIDEAMSASDSEKEQYIEWERDKGYVWDGNKLNKVKE